MNPFSSSRGYRRTDPDLDDDDDEPPAYNSYASRPRSSVLENNINASPSSRGHGSTLRLLHTNDEPEDSAENDLGTSSQSPYDYPESSEYVYLYLPVELILPSQISLQFLFLLSPSLDCSIFRVKRLTSLAWLRRSAEWES